MQICGYTPDVQDYMAGTRGMVVYLIMDGMGCIWVCVCPQFAHMRTHTPFWSKVEFYMINLL